MAEIGRFAVLLSARIAQFRVNSFLVLLTPRAPRLRVNKIFCLWLWLSASPARAGNVFFAGLRFFGPLLLNSCLFGALLLPAKSGDLPKKQSARMGPLALNRFFGDAKRFSALLNGKSRIETELYQFGFFRELFGETL